MTLFPEMTRGQGWGLGFALALTLWLIIAAVIALVAA